MKKTFIIVDLEATCFDNPKITPAGFENEIIEIGAVKVNEEGKTVGEFQAFIKPKKFPILSDFCKQLTSIKQEDVDNAELFYLVLEKFIDWTIEGNETNVTFISWGHYDKTQFQKDSKLHNITPEWINDSNHRSLKHLHGKWNNLNSPKGVGMERALKFEKIPLDGTHHRGIDDARNITKIFKKYINKFL